MANVFDRLIGHPVSLGVLTGPPAKTGLALGSVYVYATSGAAIGFRWVAPVTATLTDAYIFMSAHAGTPGVLTLELRNNISGTINKPGVTLLGTWTQSPGVTDNKWVHFTLTTPVTVTGGVEYWTVIGDAGWTTGNTATILHTGAAAPSSVASNLMAFAFTTADGFTTAGGGQNIPPLVLKFGDGSLLGAPWTNSLTYASNQLERGFKITSLTEPLIVSGVYWKNPSTSINGFKIYSGATAPGGTTDLTVVLGAGATDLGFAFFAPFTLKANTVYRCVLTYSGNISSPFGYLNEDNSQADCLAAGFGGGTLIGTIDNGAGGWTDSSDRFPQMGLVVREQGTVLELAPGWNGGFRG